MGVHGLTPFLQKKFPSVVKTLPNRFRELKGKTVAIDGTLITQRFHFAQVPHPYKHVLGWYRLLKELRDNGVNAICIFDGDERTVAKLREAERRRLARRLVASRSNLEAQRLERLQDVKLILHDIQSMSPRPIVSQIESETDLQNAIHTLSLEEAFHLQEESLGSPDVYEPEIGDYGILRTLQTDQSATDSSHTALEKEPSVEPAPALVHDEVIAGTGHLVDQAGVQSPEKLDEPQIPASPSPSEETGKHESESTQPKEMTLTIPPVVEIETTTTIPAEVLDQDEITEVFDRTSIQIHDDLVDTDDRRVPASEADKAPFHAAHEPAVDATVVPESIDASIEKEKVITEEDALRPLHAKELTPPTSPSVEPKAFTVDDWLVDTQSLELEEDKPFAIDTEDIEREAQLHATRVGTSGMEEIYEGLWKKLDDLYGNFLQHRRSSQQTFGATSPEASKDLSGSVILLPAPSLSTSDNIQESKSQILLTKGEERVWIDLHTLKYLDMNNYPPNEINGLISRSQTLFESYERRSNAPTSATYEECKMMIQAMGIPCIDCDGPYEAEALASSLVRQGKADLVASEDTDVLVYGASLLRNVTTKEKELVCISGAEVRDALDLHDSSFVDFALLLGTDFSARIHSIGPIRALRFIPAHKTIERVIEEERKYAPADVDAYLAQVQLAREVFSTLPPVPDDKQLDARDVDRERVTELLGRFRLMRAAFDDDWDPQLPLAGNYFQDSPFARRKEDEENDMYDGI